MLPPRLIKKDAAAAEDRAALAQRVSRFFSLLFLVPFFLIGGAALVFGIISVSKNQEGGWIVVGIASVFIVFASGFLAAILRGPRRTGKSVPPPDKPWLQNKDWADGRIPAEGVPAVVGMWLFAVFWNLVSTPILFVFRDEWEKGNQAILVGLLFPLVGIGLVVAAIRLTVRWKKFGRSWFCMKRVPAALGGALSGFIEVAAPVMARDGVRLRLECVRRTTSGSGKNRSTREQLLWEDERVAPREAVAIERQGTRVPVFFRLPADQPGVLDGNPAIVWRLEARAAVDGIDYSERFSVPVFHWEGDGAPPEDDPLESYERQSESAGMPAFRGVEVRDLVDGVQIHFRAARNPGTIVSLGVFTAIWTVAFWFLATKGAPIVFAAVTGFFELILVSALIFAVFHSTRVTVRAGRLSIRHWLVFPIRHRQADASSVASVEPKMGSRSGTRQFYRIEIRTVDGQRFSAGSGLPDKLQAQWLAERIAIALGL